MKKIVNYYYGDIDFYDPQDYIEVEGDGKNISDKYINSFGDKFNERDDLKAGDVIIRRYYSIGLSNSDYYRLFFNSFKYYVLETFSSGGAEKIKEKLETKNSPVKFNIKKELVIDIFLQKMRIMSE